MSNDRYVSPLSERYDICTSCSTHDGIIYHYDSFSLYNFRNHIQFDFYTGNTFALFRFDKCSYIHASLERMFRQMSS